MCLIVTDRTGAGLSEDLISSAYVNNSDGFGIMMPVGNGKIHVHRTIPASDQDCIDVYNKYSKSPMAVHFRLATLGDINKANCHPFKILNVKEHGRDAYLMHNGPQLEVPILDSEKSDTWHLVEYILKPVLERNPDLLESESFYSMLENIAEADRLTILDGKTETFTNVNFKDSDKADDLEFSNQYSLRRNKGQNYSIHNGITSNQNVNSYNSWYDDSNYPFDPYPNSSYNSKLYAHRIRSLPSLSEVLSDISDTIEENLDPSNSDIEISQEINEATALMESIKEKEVFSEDFWENKGGTSTYKIPSYSSTLKDEYLKHSYSELMELCYEDPDEFCTVLKELSYEEKSE